jgi:glycyl-tRNA synthetase beta chain
MQNFLLELMSEEMPATLIDDSAKAIEHLLLNNFKKNNLIFKKYNTYYTPKRFTFIFYNLKNSDSEIIIKGPSLKAPKKAIEGFAKSHRTSVAKLQIKEINNSNYYYFKKKITNLETENIIIKILEANLPKVPWKKSMRWGNNSLRWVRPLKNILCIYNEKKLNINFLGFKSNNFTLSSDLILNDKIIINSIDQYFSEIKNIDIVINQNERKEIIIKEAQDIAIKKNLKLYLDQHLINEVSNLVESPNLFLAEFDEKYLSLPNEVLITSMIKNQKYFPLYDHKNILSNYFIIISNIRPKDKGKQIIYGNQRVIEARLEDANFFWQKDKNEDFDNKVEELKRVIFHNKLGSIFDKISRLKILSNFFTFNLNLEKKESSNLNKAVSICKNDLLTELVREFPSLQGTMGYYYSINAGFDSGVSKAIKDHYKPYGPMDLCPETKISKILAIIDKIDTIVGFFLIDLGPTSSKDPYALRRAGLGIIRIIIKGKFSFNLSNLINESILQYVKKNSELDNNIEKLKFKIEKFILERLGNLIKQESYEKFLTYDSLYLKDNEIDIFDLFEKSQMLYEFIKSKEGENFLKAFKRILNILENSSVDKKVVSIKDIQKDLINLKYEKELYNTYIENVNKETSNFSSLLLSLKCFTKPINLFFEKVTINEKNILLKNNRLCLLSNIKTYLIHVINFSKIIKGKEL